MLGETVVTLIFRLHTSTAKVAGLGVKDGAMRHADELGLGEWVSELSENFALKRGEVAVVHMIKREVAVLDDLDGNGADVLGDCTKPPSQLKLSPCHIGVPTVEVHQRLGAVLMASEAVPGHYRGSGSQEDGNGGNCGLHGDLWYEDGQR